MANFLYINSQMITVDFAFMKKSMLVYFLIIFEKFISFLLTVLYVG